MNFPVFLFAVLLLSASAALQAKDENGLRVTVQKTTLSRDDYDAGYYWAEKIDRILGLKLELKNISFDDFPAGVVEYTILVERWGYSPKRYDRYSGKVELPALQPGDFRRVVAGASQLGGYKNYQGRYQDEIAAWKLVIRHGDAETMVYESSSSFEKYDKRAEDVESPIKEK